ncbi:hypothetical protein C5Y93_27375 [Blastopirellula marina]|uniref:Uncharacterized protein n=1 Tax=Blastopirellula marina TaxID=124 RepID=A0A2S8GC83_9BACT|nr:hypothetical protein C5Y93_27375 [Blastopirellula marina]
MSCGKSLCGNDLQGVIQLLRFLLRIEDCGDLKFSVFRFQREIGGAHLLARFVLRIVWDGRWVLRMLSEDVSMAPVCG